MKKSAFLLIAVIISFVAFGFINNNAPDPIQPAATTQNANEVKVPWITLQELDNMVQDEKWDKSKSKVMIFLYNLVHKNNWKNTKKKVMIDLYTDWCGWCKRMDAGTFADPEIAAYLKDNFHSVKLDAETTETIVFGDQEYKFIPGGRRGTNEIAITLGSVNGRIGYPTIVFLDEEMNKVLVSPGYKDAAGFKKFLVYINEEHYKKSTWEEFDKVYKAN